MRPANRLARRAQVLRAGAARPAAFHMQGKRRIIADALRAYLHQTAGFQLDFCYALTGTTAFVADAQLSRAIFDHVARTGGVGMFDLQQPLGISQTDFLSGLAGAMFFQRPLATRQPIQYRHGWRLGRCRNRKPRQKGGGCADDLYQFHAFHYNFPVMLVAWIGVSMIMSGLQTWRILSQIAAIDRIFSTIMASCHICDRS